jgi:hypothetical protein
MGEGRVKIEELHREDKAETSIWHKPFGDGDFRAGEDG